MGLGSGKVGSVHRVGWDTRKVSFNSILEIKITSRIRAKAALHCHALFTVKSQGRCHRFLHHWGPRDRWATAPEGWCHLSLHHWGPMDRWAAPRSEVMSLMPPRGPHTKGAAKANQKTSCSFGDTKQQVVDLKMKLFPGAKGVPAVTTAQERPHNKGLCGSDLVAAARPGTWHEIPSSKLGWKNQ